MNQDVLNLHTLLIYYKNIVAAILMDIVLNLFRVLHCYVEGSIMIEAMPYEICKIHILFVS